MTLPKSASDNHRADRREGLSDKPFPWSERLIVALDTPDIHEAKRLVTLLGEQVHFYKLGLELFMAGGYFELLEWLTDQGKKIFVDLKFFDVPQTVKSAVKQLRGRKATFATVHGNDEILRAACGEKNGTKILAVTVLTSLDDADLRDLGFQVNAEQLVLSRARRALEIGCDGVISSGLEAQQLRIIVPGIRPISNTDDQKRTVDVEAAFLNGADYIVVGRPIRQAPDPLQAAREMQSRIQKLFAPN
jgi:orotidine-5'-phosphate decarboxylase